LASNQLSLKPKPFDVWPELDLTGEDFSQQVASFRDVTRCVSKYGFPRLKVGENPTPDRLTIEVGLADGFRRADRGHYLPRGLVAP
jgi:hypothetical protein